MIIGSCIVTFRLKGVKSLKEKRSLLKRLTNRIAKNFNVAIAEVGQQDIPDRAELGMAVVSTSKRHVESQLTRIIAYIERFGEPDIEIIDCEREIF